MVYKTNGGFLISKIKQVQGRVFEKLLIQSGVSQFNSAQGRILFVLWENDNAPISELAERTGLAKTTLTSMLDRLEASGHIKRVRDQKNRRIVRIVLTESAKGLKAQYDEVSLRMNHIFYEGFTDEEIVAFEDVLERILNNLTRRRV